MTKIAHCETCVNTAKVVISKIGDCEKSKSARADEKYCAQFSGNPCSRLRSEIADLRVSARNTRSCKLHNRTSSWAGQIFIPNPESFAGYRKIVQHPSIATRITAVSMAPLRAQAPLDPSVISTPKSGEYNGNMRTIPSFMPPEPTNLEIEVTVDQNDGMFQADLFCDLNHCGKDVTIFSNGPKTTQNLRCLEHGLLASFPDQIAFQEFVRFLANKLLQAKGHELIEREAMCIVGEDETSPKAMN